MPREKIEFMEIYIPIEIVFDRNQCSAVAE